MIESLNFQGADGLTIRADAYGRKHNPAVLFMHGGGQTRHAWGSAAEQLADDGFYAVTMDMRGHGESGWCPQGQYNIDHFVADFHQVLRQMPVHESDCLPVIIGASLGGITALAGIARAAKSIARALVLVDIVPKINPQGRANIVAFMKSRPDGFISLEDAANTIAVYLPHRPRRTDLSGLKKNLRLGEDGRYYWHWDPQFMFGEQDIHTPQTRRVLQQAAAQIEVPTLLVKGSLSEIVDDDGVDDFCRSIKHGEVVEVAGAGHMVAGDVNTIFAEEVKKFLRKL